MTAFQDEINGDALWESLLSKGDGTALSALRMRQNYLQKTLGEFRGVQVDRTLHRPRDMSLGEILSSTDAAGYWSQICTGDPEPYSVFNIPFAPPARADQVLKHVGSNQHPHLLGNSYASEWSFLGDAQTTRFRLLAVGPMPVMPQTPL
ncbi:hypothetical protein [Endobacterium cereale]|uniref:hypothetical protein n=1 Tax=Endobacterium cereale TaxID=2663029 RepID=UPI002B49B316|nr:hypothetical protein [Endobacterium cereale]MEB2848123.1 hypothetical protein [Endobacterium cereale]